MKLYYTPFITFENLHEPVEQKVWRQLAGSLEETYRESERNWPYAWYFNVKAGVAAQYCLPRKLQASSDFSWLINCHPMLVFWHNPVSRHNTCLRWRTSPRGTLSSHCITSPIFGWSRKKDRHGINYSSYNFKLNNILISVASWWLYRM